jgi:cytochrome c556
MRRTCVGLVVVVLAGLAMLLSDRASSRADEKYQPIATIRQFMSGAVKPGSAEIKALLEGTGPADAKVWKSLGTHGALLAEVGQLLVLGDRAKDEVWTTAATKLSDAAKKVSEAAEKEDLEACREAASAIAQACGPCHKAHKKS